MDSEWFCCCFSSESQCDPRRRRRRSRRVTGSTLLSCLLLPLLLLLIPFVVTTVLSFRATPFQNTIRSPLSKSRQKPFETDGKLRSHRSLRRVRRTFGSPLVVMMTTPRFAERRGLSTMEQENNTASFSDTTVFETQDEGVIGDDKNHTGVAAAAATTADTATTTASKEKSKKSLFYFADVVGNNTMPLLDVDTVDGTVDGSIGSSIPDREEERELNGAVTRRDVFRYGTILTGAVCITGLTFAKTDPLSPSPSSPSKTKPRGSITSTTTTTTAVPSPKLEPVNLTRVVSQTNINVTASCDKMCVSIDSSNFTFNKVEKAKAPDWLPAFLAPKSQVVKKISNSELLVAATTAGSITEMVRTGLLYPLQTVKTRIQADRNLNAAASHGPVQQPLLLEEIAALGATVRQKIGDGDLYAGLSPTLLVSVPATGIYYGVRDVTKRLLFLTPLDPTWIAVGGALVGDVVSLCFRVPSDALAIRLQAQNNSTGDWLGDSFRFLPAIILTDLPYLLSKIVLNKSLIRGDLSMSEYALFAVFASAVAGFLTTPFDVARTRILLNKWSPEPSSDERNGVETNDGVSSSGDNIDIVDIDIIDIEEDHHREGEISAAIANPGDSVLRTMIQITKEGDGGIANLFSGWLERILYLGIGRAWLEPIQLIGYIGIRDAVLLEWF